VTLGLAESFLIIVVVFMTEYSEINIIIYLTNYYVFSSGSVGSEALWESSGRLEHRCHFVHIAVRISSVLRRERRESLRSNLKR